MRIERTKNATRNIFFGFLLKVYQLFGPFLLRTMMIYILGMEYIGLNSLFAAVLQVLNMAELGVGSAMVYSMYKPIVEEDTKKICALMNLYKFYYRIIGSLILILGLIIAPFIPNLISGHIPEGINIYILYLLNLGATVLSYWLFAYKNCLLTAHQRIDIGSKITIVINTLQYVTQILVLFYLKNYYVYLIVALFSQALLNVITAFVVEKMYPQYKAIGFLDQSEIKEINKKIKALFTSKLGEVIVNSVDTIIISVFLGLTMLAMYNNYYYILTSIMSFITLIFNACTAGIGNSLIVETKEKNYKDLQKFVFIIAWIGGICTACLLCLYQPFMELWVGSEYLLPFSCVICLCFYFYIREINQIFIVYKDAAGMWYEDRFRPLFTALTNLFLNMLLVNFIGIYGVLLSTVISTLGIGMPWVIYNLFTNIFKVNPWNFIYRILSYFGITIIVCIITYLCCSWVNGDLILVLLLRLVVCIFVPNLLYVIIFYRTQEFKEVLKLADNIIGKKLRFIHIINKKLNGSF